jgi:hypothetical protein
MVKEYKNTPVTVLLGNRITMAFGMVQKLKIFL